MLRILRRLVRLAMLGVMYPFAAGRGKNRIPVLAYHAIHGDRYIPYAVSPGKFRRQMACLKKMGYETISLDALYSFLNGNPLNGTGRHVLLTFDDGYKDFVYSGLPVLKSQGFSACVALVSGCCDAAEKGGDCGCFRLPTMSWQDAAHVMIHGVELGAHGVTHRKLTDVSGPDAEEEIRGSKKRMEDVLGAIVRVFCFPSGACNMRLSNCIKNEDYMFGFTTKPVLVRAYDNPFQLGRITIDSELTLLEYKAMLTPAAEWFYYIRNRVLGLV